MGAGGRRELSHCCVEREGLKRGISAHSDEVQMVLPEYRRRKTGAARAELLNAAARRVAHVIAVQQEKRSTFAATDQKMLHGPGRLIHEKRRAARSQILVAALPAGVVARREVVCH